MSAQLFLSAGNFVASFSWGGFGTFAYSQFAVEWFYGDGLSTVMGVVGLEYTHATVEGGATASFSDVRRKIAAMFQLIGRQCAGFRKLQMFAGSFRGATTEAAVKRGSGT